VRERDGGVALSAAQLEDAGAGAMAQKLTMARRCCICEVRPAEDSVGAERVSRNWGRVQMPEMERGLPCLFARFIDRYLLGKSYVVVVRF
jgi:hypothetical protein